MSVNATEFIILQLNIKQNATAAVYLFLLPLLNTNKAVTKRECEFMTDYKKDIFPSFPFWKINTSLCCCMRLNCKWKSMPTRPMCVSYATKNLNMKHKPVVCTPAEWYFQNSVFFFSSRFLCSRPYLSKYVAVQGERKRESECGKSELKLL